MMLPIETGCADIQDNGALPYRFNVSIHVEVLNKVKWLAPWIKNRSIKNITTGSTFEIAVVLDKRREPHGFNFFSLPKSRRFRNLGSRGTMARHKAKPTPRSQTKFVRGFSFGLNAKCASRTD